MSEMTALRSLVAEKLSAAVEEIFSAVERMIPEKKKKLHTEEMSVEQQRAVVHRRLSVVADEICRILETIMAQHEAEVSCSQEEMQSHHQLLDVTLKTETSSRRTDKLLLHVSGCENDFSSELQKCDQSWSTGQVEKTSDPLQIKDASTETDCDLIHSKTSHLHQREEKGSWTVETETRGETVSDQEAPSLRDSEAVVEDNETDEELDKKPNKRKTQGADCVKRHGKKRKITPANKIQTVGQSCCRVCGKLFRYKRSFLKHVLTHEQSSDLCGACGKHLDSDESLKVHLQTHNDANICRDQKESDTESKVENSDEDWRDSEGTDDEKEGSRVGNQSKIKGGKNKDLSNLKYRCKVCEKSFTYRTSFLKHVQEEEGDADLCGVCGRPFKSKKSLRLHLQTYIRTNDCEVCGKHFDGHQQLEMHMRTHTGEKPYVCAVCGKAFAQNGNLMGHMRVHTGERPYICSVCGQSFSFKEYMTAHMRIHTGEKPFLCSYCGKGFRQRGTLKTHMMIHTGESTHQCPVCDKKFYKSGALKIHMRSHTGEKPYLCNVCGKSFQASGSLTKHMGIHEGERTHRCSTCGKGFLRKDDLKRHAQTHGDESTQLTSL